MQEWQVERCGLDCGCNGAWPRYPVIVDNTCREARLVDLASGRDLAVAPLAISILWRALQEDARTMRHLRKA